MRPRSSRPVSLSICCTSTSTRALSRPWSAIPSRCIACSLDHRASLHTEATRPSQHLPPDWFCPQNPAVPGTSRRALFNPTLANSQSSPSPNENDTPGSISEHEYRVRVGKACRLLIETLPDFMHRGAADLDDVESSSDHAGSNQGRNTGGGGSPFLGQSLLRRSPWKGKTKATEQELDSDARGAHSFTSIYHSSIAFCFRPPIPHIGLGSGSGKPRSESESTSASSLGSDLSPASGEEAHTYAPTISFKGRTLYVASSHVLRHALSALFYDTMLTVETARFEGRSQPGASWPGISRSIRGRFKRADVEGDSGASGRDRLTIRLRFEGISRMSSAPHTYTVLFRYEFDRATGKIVKHAVDNIQPVPGSKVWAGLTSAWGHLSPCGGGAGGGAGSGGAAGSGSGSGGPGNWYIWGDKSAARTDELIEYQDRLQSSVHRSDLVPFCCDLPANEVASRQ